MQGNAHILIADDDYEDRFMMAESFKELGLSEEIAFAEDGSLLLEQLGSINCKEIGLIVLDLNMPLLNGTETLRVIKNNPLYNSIPVIIFSTSVNEIEKDACMQLGAQAYITKPNMWDGYLDTCQMMYNISSKGIS